jgi:proliferating cell nuclear antigen PCNA
MINLKLEKEYFNEFECDQPVPIRLNLLDMNRFMKRGSAGDTLKLELDQKRNKLKMVFHKGKSRRTFSLTMLVEDEEEARELKPPLTSKFTISMAELGEAVKDAILVSDQATIKVTEDAVSMAAGGDSGDVDIEIGAVKDIETEGASATYQVEFLKDLIKAGNFAKDAVIELADDLPMRVTTSFGDNRGEVVYVLAPFVQEQDGYDEDYDETDEEDTDFGDAE